MPDLWEHECAAWAHGYETVCGVDEAGASSRLEGEVGSPGPCVLVMTLRFFSTMCAQACGKPCTGKF